MRSVSQQDEEYQRLLKDFEAKKSEVEEANARYKALVDDETYKQQSCKLCPHCSRVVQKVLS